MRSAVSLTIVATSGSLPLVDWYSNRCDEAEECASLYCFEVSEFRLLSITEE